MSADRVASALRLHERLRFELESGQVKDGPRRYVIMRADVLMGSFDGLQDDARRAALASLGRSVTRFGSDSVRAYLAEVGPRGLLRSMVDGSASLGWGRWTFRSSERRLWVRVRNSPYAAGTARRDGVACEAIAGMVTAVAEALWSEPASARELRCACSRDAGRGCCLFVAMPAASA